MGLVCDISAFYFGADFPFILDYKCIW